MAIADLTSEWHRTSLLPPFQSIKAEDYRPAFTRSLETARMEIDRIAGRADEPTFENVVDQLEVACEELDRVASVFFNLAVADSNDELRAIELEVTPELARFQTEVSMNEVLFARLENLWSRRDQLPLTQEQQMVLKRHYRSFLRSGARLEGKARDRFAEINERMAVLCTQFSQNLLADEASWHMPIEEQDLAELPAFLRTAAGQAARQRELDGYIITLDRSLIEPFLKFSPNRKLREAAYLAWSSRGAGGGDTDNREIIGEIIRLRQEMAQLLGYACYADLKLEDEMAAKTEAASELLDTVWKPARAAAEADQAEFQEALAADGHPGRLEPWDWRYYAERRRKAKHDLDEEQIKKHFQLDRLVDAVFDVAGRLFNLTFRQSGVAAYHADCRVWEVTRNGSPVAVFIGDFYSRPSKRSGAWCSGFADQRKLGGSVNPVIVNVCNFIKPAEGEPCLLSHDDARTLFHEFGHALHAMLSDVTYPSVSGTSVARDFVELPSQLFENWLESSEILDKYAIDPESGNSLPRDLRNKMTAARNVDQPFSTVEYLACAFVDLDYHSGNVPEDPVQRQDELLEEIGMPHAIGMRHAAPHFQHVFAGDGYAAGYYSYLWADVLASDAFEAFQEEGGPFSAVVASRLEKEILSTGGSRSPEELYTAFRGRLPRPDALLRKRGIATAS